MMILRAVFEASLTFLSRVSPCQIITFLGHVVIDINEIWHADLVI